MPTLALILTWMIALTAALAWPVLAGSPTLGDDLTRWTVRVALAFYAVAAWFMLSLRPADWRAETSRGRFTRLCWTLAWVAFVIHVGVAFHFYHHWSHAAAVEHVRERSGVGEGVFVSYLFTLVWTVDVGWWWLRPGRYASRPRWVGGSLHGFMVFMIVMATVVYEDGAIRWVAIVVGGALLYRFATLRRSVTDVHATAKLRES
jgi:hypothetical protein